MSASTLQTVREGIISGNVIPYLGPEALSGVVEEHSGMPIPADSDSLIFAINGGKPMAPKLMYEFPRAAMNLELKKGRKFVERALTETYGAKTWSNSTLHTWLADLNLPYVIDTNRDLLLQKAYAERPHTLILGVARIAGTDYRFKLYEHDGSSYTEKTLEQVNPQLPILFKPLGTPEPSPSYIASDADFVDYITELMGGFAIPSFVKSYRENKQYALLGLRFTRDTERMVVTELTFAAQKHKGYAFLKEPTAKEVRFCERLGFEVVEESPAALLVDQKAA